MFINDLTNATNYSFTENGAVKHNSTTNAVLDMFAMGGAYRSRQPQDIEALFGDAYRQDKLLAIKCLFYLRDVRGGQGERRFFRIAFRWLIRNDEKVAIQLLPYIPEYGRYDDLIEVAYGTSCETYMANILRLRFASDLQAAATDHDEDISLLAKWLPSENASSKATKAKARWCIKTFGISAKKYRQALSELRKRIKVLERTMSENHWDDIEFNKIPSIAGLKYRNCFSTREETKDRYIDFMSSKTTKVNADVLNPVDIAAKALNLRNPAGRPDEVNTLQKYWDNLKDYYQGREENAIAVIDVSGSMHGTPLAAAVGMGAYIAEKSKGDFANYFITFSHEPTLIKFQGDNIVDKFQRCVRADWEMDTNIEAVMDLLLSTAVRSHTPKDEMPARLYIFSDMEFNACMTANNLYHGWRRSGLSTEGYATLFEKIRKKWLTYGYEMPMITFWNLNARSNNIPAIGDKFNYISGFSMSQMEAVMSGKTAYDLMLDVLNKPRYKVLEEAWAASDRGVKRK